MTIVTCRIAGIPREQFPRSILVVSSRHPHEDATRMSRVSGVSSDYFPVQLATCTYLIDWPAVCPFVRVLCRSPNFTSTTRTTCCGQVASILVRHARSPRDMLATSSRVCHEDATRKLLPWNFSLSEFHRDCSCE